MSIENTTLSGMSGWTTMSSNISTECYDYCSLYPDGTTIDSTITYFVPGYVQSTVEMKTEKKGISPILYFKYAKSKFKMLEKRRFEGRLKRIQSAFRRAVENGQEVLGAKIQKYLSQEVRESVLYAKGIRHFIEKTDLDKHRYNIRDGHISNTLLKDYTRAIPKHVTAKYVSVKNLFDEFVVYHYWNEETKDVKKMSSDEKSKMRDPILFGKIKESDRLYFIADWEDEYCTLTFDKMVDAIGKEDSAFELTKEPKKIVA